MGNITSTVMLYPGQYLFSKDGDIMLIYTNDGRLVIYNAILVNRTNDLTGASEYYGDNPNFFMIDVGGGNVEVYSITKYKEFPQAPNGRGGKCVFTSNGYIKLYDSNNNLYWTSPNWSVSNQKSPYRNIMQKDGNLVIYDKNNKAIWASGTNYRPRNDQERLKDNRNYYYGTCTVNSC